ncbi:MAG: hypothetical protein KAI72_06260, partial [Candidatus Pacebacteria bacterium]|nr:hypothetical protein [Candidatus Paceibacterota bacterium]
MVPDSAALWPGAWSIGFTPLMFEGAGNNDGYDDIRTYASDGHFKFPSVTSFDWTEYYEDVQIPIPAAGELPTKAIEVRLHPYGRITGTLYLDDLKIEKLLFPEVSGIGSFEQDLPSYWTKGSEPGTSTLVWAEDQSFALSRSLKIMKPGTTDTLAMWRSENMIDNWTPKRDANNKITLGAWVKTENVNTNPGTNDDAKWMIKYTFYDQSDVLIGDRSIDIDQSAATSDWMEVEDSVVLPTDAYTVIIDFIGGKDATGTVWADAFQSSWNRTLELPTGWFNWFPTIDTTGWEVTHGYENTIITTEEAHTGLHSLKFELPFDRDPHDAFVG